ncbi:uncharacterized protein LOC127255167 [Andrographis paniculata]|uniref:uncharacterized protein LOC127255167 n=1 Tax=Andrographis paniculata TaxID=175694 RepID=UPI0021E8B135|nr:uncharacterized protein LOC127255167 [Andrographis paniculata]
MAENMRKPNLSTKSLNSIAQFLLQGSMTGKPAYGKFTKASSKFGVTRKMIHRVWKKAQEQLKSGQAISLCSKKRTLCHAKKKPFDKATLQNILVHKRGTYRNIAKEMHVSKRLVGYWAKAGLIRPHTNAIKPSLSEKNKIERLKFGLKSLEINDELKVVQFRSMSKIVHIDEKWFNLTKETESYYLTPDETEPYRFCQSKRFITKVIPAIKEKWPVDRDKNIIV